MKEIFLKNQAIKVSDSAFKKYNLPSKFGTVVDATPNTEQLVTVSLAGQQFDLHLRSIKKV